MADPFRPDKKSQLLREAQVGLSIVAILLVLLIYVAFYRITGQGRHIPDHVRNAPVAKLVWPGGSGQPDVIREIEMTPQQFRDTRMPKSHVEAVGTPRSVAPVSKAFSSPQQSAYKMKRLTGAMAETKTSRPKTKLGNQNFSPNLKPISKKTLQPKVSPSKPIASKRPTPIGGATPPSDPFEMKPLKASALKNPSLIPVEIEKPESMKVDSKIELASGEEHGNEFKASLPTASPIAIAPKLPDMPKPSVRSTSDLGSNQFLPEPLRNKLNNSPKSNISDQNNDFISTGFKVDSVEKLKPIGPSLPQFPESNLESSLRPQSTPNLSGQPDRPSPKSPLKSPLKSLKETQPTSVKSKLTGPLANPFRDPVLSGSRPVVDDSEGLASQRLPRLKSDQTPPTQKEPIEQDTQKTSEHEYVSKAGDSFWSISQSVYFDGRYFRALFKYNESRVTNFDSLEVGTIIATPRLEDLQKLWPDLCPKPETSQAVGQNLNSKNQRVYVTRTGDTLFDIARQRLGQASKYSEILELNQAWLGQDVSHLTPLQEGIRIVMPR